MCFQEEKYFIMAKKKNQARRVPRASEPRMFGDGKPSVLTQQNGQAGQQPPAAARNAVQPVRSANTLLRTANVPQDYGYVLSDLRRLAILAASVFVVLIALGLLIR